MAHSADNGKTPTRRSTTSSRGTSSSLQENSQTSSYNRTASSSSASHTTQNARHTASSSSSQTATPTRVRAITQGTSLRNANNAQASDEAVAQKPYRASQNSGSVNVPVVIGIVVAVIVLCLLISLIANAGRIHSNIYIGEVDVGGMTKAEAITAVEDYYKTVLDSSVTVYVSPNVKSQKQADELEYMISVNDTYLENHSEILVRVISLSELEGGIDSTSLVEEAYSYGRGFSGFFKRIALIFSTYVIEPYAYYSDTAIETILDSLDESVGDQMLNCSIYIEGGVAAYTEGQEGYTISKEVFLEKLNEAFFSGTSEGHSFALYSSYTPMAIDAEYAQSIVDQLNNAIGDGFVCYYDGNAWSASAYTLGSWITISTVENDDGTWSVEYSLDESAIHSWLLTWTLSEGDSIPVTMETTSKGGTVYPDVSGTIPSLTNAVSDLYVALFGEETQECSEGAMDIDGNPVYIQVESMNVPESLSIEEAIESGVVSPIYSYSISYINGSTTDNRTHNVLLAASMVDGTVVKAGETFSFNDIVGETSEENGFAIGTVIDSSGEYVDGAGGGVCQVSTTLFNAVYYAGYPIVERTNHSLYSANYPDGLDATVDYPSTDFKWQNNSDSDIYISFTDDGTSITCTLYGANPNYTVWTYTFDWEFISEYPTKYLIDTTKSSDYYEVYTAGVDAKSNRVWRKVLDSTATELIYEYAYTSVYQAIT